MSASDIGASNRFNDGAIDRAGRLWVGTAGDTPENALYCIDNDRSVRVAETERKVSNGIGWSPNHTTMYYSDSGGQGVVFAYDYDLETGALSNRRVFMPPTGDGSVADGLTVDRDGFIWVAFWDGWRVECRAPDGALTKKIDMPVQRPTSCIFGGRHMDELYVTSASIGCDLAQQPHAGKVFRIHTDHTGMAEPASKITLT